MTIGRKVTSVPSESGTSLKYSVSMCGADSPVSPSSDAPSCEDSIGFLPSFTMSVSEGMPPAAAAAASCAALSAAACAAAISAPSCMASAAAFWPASAAVFWMLAMASERSAGITSAP